MCPGSKMKTHKMPDGSMMAGAKHKSKPVKKSGGGKGSDAMKKKMAALRAMRKKK
tara:strand:+ start:86 stop:250 length:165 start_codon:yes stop_codon:yes gene_type:complete